MFPTGALSFSARRTPGALPREFDVRGSGGSPRGVLVHPPTPLQLKSLEALRGAVGAPVTVRYNGLTATPHHLFSYAGYLSAPSPADPEAVARGFLARWAGVWGFSGNDLDTLALTSRATIDDLGVTVLKFDQVAGGLPVYHGEVVVNVTAAGQVLSVGGDSFPRLAVVNQSVISPEQAITLAAAELGIAGFSPRQTGVAQVLTTHGDLPPVYASAPRYAGGGVFTDDIVVQKVVFPLGAVGRVAYQFTLTSPHLNGVMWEHVVDAETGQVLRRASLTSFGDPGGGTGQGRRSTLRPDVQDRLEAMNAAGTATGLVFDAVPTALSGRNGFGRSPAVNTSPTYAPESETARNSGRGFRFSHVTARNENPLVYDPGFGQVRRGLPDAANPSAESPLGWFYLPTDSGGAEVASPDANRGATRGYGYVMASEAAARNLAANSPSGDGLQPFSSTASSVRSLTLADGRTLSRVFESNYTEGNNVMVSDDRANDDEATAGIRGFALGRKFSAPHFSFFNRYEYGGADAVEDVSCNSLLICSVTYPPTADADIFPGTVSLFFFNNVMHDYLYSIGFTEKLWNFQQDNFGRGGAGGDGVIAQVQDGSGTNNANFSTPSDGSHPRMQMFLFTEGTFRRADGDFDFDVVAHEHYHGVSNRSVGKGGSGALGFGLVGEPGGQGEGWSDFVASSLTDDDSEGEYVTGEFDTGIRRLPYTNYRYSYGSINGETLNVRDQSLPDIAVAGIPFEVHDIGEVWCATLWDMRELMIVKDPNGVFFDGTRRLGGGKTFFAGYRQLQSVDQNHPIDYRTSFSTDDPATIVAGQAIVRPGLVASEIARLGHRHGPLCTAVANGARLADTLVLRGMQLSPTNPSFVESRDSILLADRELTGGENLAIIWRAFASHGVGANADSTTSVGDDEFTGSAGLITEDFTVPAGVLDAESLGAPAPPAYALTNTTANTVTVTINNGTPVPGAATYIISRATAASGPFVRVATLPATQAVYQDNDLGQGLTTGKAFYYQVRATRNPETVSGATTKSITLRIGKVLYPAPSFTGIASVTDPGQCNRLVLSWGAATAEKKQSVVYDVYRVDRVDPGDGTQDPTFAPAATNRVATGLTSLTYTDTGLTPGNVYYYIVQARDASTGTLDTRGVGNRVVKFNAPTTGSISSVPLFAVETFESSSASTRFLPILVDLGSGPNQAVPAWQRASGVDHGNGTTSAMMYAPDFDPGSDGAPSDSSVVVGPLTLTPTSVLDFDQFYSAEATFDGGVVELALGAPVFNSTQYPDNSTTFDLGNYMIQGGYNGNLNGNSLGLTSILNGRRAFTGARSLHHARVALGTFALGGRNNPTGKAVFIRFRMTSDAGTSAGPNSGWYVDNLVVNNLDTTVCPLR
jgi:hypothetical protein